jgi:uncharacterized protein (TIGR03382 family)
MRVIGAAALLAAGLTAGEARASSCNDGHCPCDYAQDMGLAWGEVVSVEGGLRVALGEVFTGRAAEPGEVVGGPTPELWPCAPAQGPLRVGEKVLAVYPGRAWNEVGECPAFTACSEACAAAADAEAIRREADACVADCAESTPEHCRSVCERAAVERHRQQCAATCADEEAEACAAERPEWLTTIGVWATPWGERMVLGAALNGDEVVATPESIRLVRPGVACRDLWPEPQPVPCGDDPSGPGGCQSAGGAAALPLLGLALLGVARRRR